MHTEDAQRDEGRRRLSSSFVIMMPPQCAEDVSERCILFSEGFWLLPLVE